MVKSWDDSPQGLRSLYEMLRIRAAGFVEFGKQLEEIKTEFSGMSPTQRSNPVDRATGENFAKRMDEMNETCAGLELPVTRTLIHQTMTELTSAEDLPTFQLVGQAFDSIERVYRAELESRLFLLILPHRSTFWTDKESNYCGPEIGPLAELLKDSFQDALYDAIEAGNCFSCERFTACVYHLMRVAEFGLIATGDSLAVPESQKRSWDKVLRWITADLKKRESENAPNWESDRKKYNDLCSWFTAIKNGWRNPACHTPRIYMEPTARGLFPAIVALFEHLKSYGIQQATMPIKSIALPDEDVD